MNELYPNPEMPVDLWLRKKLFQELKLFVEFVGELEKNEILMDL